MRAVLGEVAQLVEPFVRARGGRNDRQVEDGGGNRWRAQNDDAGRMPTGGQVVGQMTGKAAFVEADEDAAVRLGPDQVVRVLGTEWQIDGVADPHGVNEIVTLAIVLDDG